MKGYELYSWQTLGSWSHVLISGTNRSKTVEEITTGPDSVSPDGWVKVSAAGVEGLKAQLGRLPQNESIFWIGRQPFELPPAAILDTVTGYCTQRGLSLHMVP